MFAAGVWRGNLGAVGGFSLSWVMRREVTVLHACLLVCSSRVFGWGMVACARLSIPPTEVVNGRGWPVAFDEVVIAISPSQVRRRG